MLPGTLGPQDFTVPASTVRGRVAVSAMKRLVGLLAEGEGEVEATLGLSLDEAGRRTVSGHIKARLPLLCNRCLQRYDHLVDTAFRVVVVDTGAEADALPDELDSFISGGGAVRPEAVVEDELLLSLPVVARHDSESDCGPPTHSSGATREALGPLAGLKDRLNRRKQD